MIRVLEGRTNICIKECAPGDVLILKTTSTTYTLEVVDPSDKTCLVRHPTHYPEGALATFEGPFDPHATFDDPEYDGRIIEGVGIALRNVQSALHPTRNTLPIYEIVLNGTRLVA